ncbi:hypothetical protein KP79_PYT21297 [Mizuhopecten yessoensis]|uniref:G-protein coupled receptors family 2 profile 2 domain-containing protein n=1 Tax=Mizuhopecten yessoensis TaxID=6573 RepID=A0A210PL79_MIZYE|nr:hypothetical protein KP79_PYT21297 [Mizuhopecten yessoensis]
MTNPSTEAWTTVLENITRSTPVMENFTIGPAENTPLDLSNWVEALTLLTTNLSIILSMFLLLIFRCIVQTKEDLIVYLVQFLAVIDLFFCVGMDMGIAYYTSSDKGKYESFCVVESFICTFFDLVSFFYTLYVIIYVFCVTVYKAEWMKGKTAKRIYHSLAWGVPGE